MIEPAYKVNIRRGFDQHYQASDAIWQHSQSFSDSLRPRPTPSTSSGGGATKLAITNSDWSRTLFLSRQLFARVTEVAGAIQQKNHYVIGNSWEPRFDGENREWGKIAEDYLDDWFQSCNLRGEPFDWKTSLYVDSLSIDRDGDSAMISTVIDGEAKLQFISAHQIACRSSRNTTDKAGFSLVNIGRFAGLRIYNGVIFGKFGDVIGYNVLGDCPDDDRQVGIESCQLLYEPEWSDQGRGIPKMATSLLSWMDYEDIHHFLKKQVKMDSAQGLLHYNESGEAQTESDFILGRGEQTNSDVKVEQIFGNEILYFKAGTGSKLEPFRSDRPSPNVDAFTMRLVRGCLQSMGWFFELYDPSKIGGASTRLIQDMARSSIRSKQRLVQKRAKRAVAHALSHAMTTGRIPKNDSADWLSWSFTLPSRITVDAHYDDETSMNRIKLGAGTYEEFFGEKGKWWEDEVRQRVREQSFFESECQRQKVNINKVQILTPNGNTSPDDSVKIDEIPSN